MGCRYVITALSDSLFNAIWQDNIRKHAAEQGINVTKTIKNNSRANIEHFVAWVST